MWTVSSILFCPASRAWWLSLIHIYPASKILTSAAFDSLSQFGALVTNGQEELASLAYLCLLYTSRCV